MKHTARGWLLVAVALAILVAAWFSSGEAVGAEDVVASLRGILERPLATAAMLSPVESVSAPDPRTVEIRTRSSSPFLLARLTAGFVAPEAAMKGSMSAVAGTGPTR